MQRKRRRTQKTEKHQQNDCLSYSNFPQDLFKNVFGFFTAPKDLTNAGLVNKHWCNFAMLELQRDKIYLKKIEETFDEEASLVLVEGEKCEITYNKLMAELEEHKQKSNLVKIPTVDMANPYMELAPQAVAAYLHTNKAVPFLIAIAYQIGRMEHMPLKRDQLLQFQFPVNSIGHLDFLSKLFLHPYMTYNLAKKIGKSDSAQEIDYLLVENILAAQHHFGKEKGRALINKWYAPNLPMPSFRDIQVKQSQALDAQRNLEEQRQRCKV